MMRARVITAFLLTALLFGVVSPGFTADITGSWAVCLSTSFGACQPGFNFPTTLVGAADGSFAMEFIPNPPLGSCIYTGTVDPTTGVMTGTSSCPHAPDDGLTGTVSDTEISGGIKILSCIFDFHGVRECAACDDGNPCTTNGCGVTACSSGSSCTFSVAPTGMACGSSPCAPGACNLTTCKVAPVNCDDGNPCTADTCDAGTGACTFTPIGGSCDDGNACTTGDVCTAGQCVGEPSVTCGSCETCDPSAGCVVGPKPACRTSVDPGKNRLRLRSRTGAASLTWGWRAGTATTAADFGDPLASDDYDLCVFDAAPPAPRLVAAMTAEAGSTCGSSPCWRAVGEPAGARGYDYRGRTPFAPDGVSRVRLVPGATGRAKVSVEGRGANLTLPLPLTVTPPVRVQLQSGNGQCWEATYQTPQQRLGVYAAHGE